MSLAQCIQFGVEGEAVSTTGEVHKVCNSLVYDTQSDDWPDAGPDFFWRHGVQAIWDAVLTLLPSSYSTNRVVIQRPWQPAAPLEVFPYQSQGLRDELPLPTFTAVHCNLKCFWRGRPFRGWRRIGPVCLTDSDGSRLTPGALAAWRGVVDGFASTVVVNQGGSPTYSLRPVVFSRAHTVGFPTPTVFVGDYIVSAEVNPVLSTQRHRRVRTVTAP